MVVKIDGENALWAFQDQKKAASAAKALGIKKPPAKKAAKKKTAKSK